MDCRETTPSSVGERPMNSTRATTSSPTLLVGPRAGFRIRLPARPDSSSSIRRPSAAAGLYHCSTTPGTVPAQRSSAQVALPAAGLP